MASLLTALVLACLLAAGSPLPVEAQPEQKDSEYARVVAAAVAEFQRGRFVEARALFETAHRLEPSARTLRGLGFADFASERYALAASELEAALADTRRPLPPEQRPEVTDFLTRARSLSGSLAVTLSPAHASLRVNGVPVQDTQLRLDPGDHVIEASAAGFAAERQQIHIDAGERRSLEVALVSLASSEPDDAVDDPDDSAGSDTTQRTAALIVGGVGAAGVIVGSVFGVRSIVKHNESDRYCPNGRTCHDARGVLAMDSAIRAGDASTVAFVLGGLAVAGSAVLWFTAPEQERFSARLGLGLGSLQLDARW
jgi:hypothetical protein